MEIKLIAVDVDGTLVGDDHLTLPEINIEALRKAHNQGIVTVISSGRTLKITEKEIEQLKCVDYMVLSNGAAVMNLITGEVIYDNYLDKENLERIMDVIEKYPVVYEVYAREKAFVNQYSKDNYLKANLPEVFLVDYITRFEVSDDIRKDVMENHIEKINVDYIEEEYWDSLLQDMKSAGEFEFSAGFVGNMEITAKNADKGTGLKVLCDRLGIGKENVMVFGDSANDATMLQWAGISYAMKNGNEAAKSAAKHITERTNAEGGVGDTILNYLTNNKK